MATETEAAGAGGAATAELTLLDRIVEEGKMAVQPSQRDYAKKLLGQFASQILDEA